MCVISDYQLETEQHQCPYMLNTSNPALRQLYMLITIALCNRADHYIFAPWFLLLLSFFSSPNISVRRLDVYHTSSHGVALV